jgi:hypothetical protein
MPKKSNSSRVLKKATNLDTKRNSVWLEEYRDFFALKTQPVTEAFIQRLGEELAQWSLKEDSLTLTSFCKMKGLTRMTFHRWKDKYPELNTAYQFAVEQFADKREVGGLTRKLDPTFAWNSLPKYDPEWQQFMQWKASLKQDDGNQQKVVVEINDLSKGKE